MYAGSEVVAFAESESRWWTWSGHPGVNVRAKRLSRVEITGDAAAIVASWDLPIAVDQVLVDPVRGVAIAMDTSLGLAGSAACVVRLEDGRILAHGPVPTGRVRITFCGT